MTERITPAHYTAGPGTVAVLPRRLRHAYVVTSATARFLTLHTPGGFEQFAAEVGQPAAERRLPDPGPIDPVALGHAASLPAIELVGPPPRQ